MDFENGFDEKEPIDKPKKTNGFGKFILSILPLVAFEAIMTMVQLAAMAGIFVYLLFIKRSAIEYIYDEFMDIALGSGLMGLTLLSQGVTLIVFLIVYLKVFLKNRKLESPAKVFDIKGIIFLIIGFSGVEIAVSSILGLVEAAFPKSMESYASFIEQSGLADLTFVSVIATIIMAPILEEIVFRGMTMRLARRFTSSFIAVNIIQAAFFGIAHLTSLNLVQPLYAFALGLVLGFVCKEFNSIYASMIAHLVFNFFGTIGGTLVFGTEEPSLMRLSITCLIATVIATVFMLLIARNGHNKERAALYNEESAVLFDIEKKETVKEDVAEELL